MLDCEMIIVFACYWKWIAVFIISLVGIEQGDFNSQKPSDVYNYLSSSNINLYHNLRSYRCNMPPTVDSEPDSHALHAADGVVHCAGVNVIV